MKDFPCAQSVKFVSKICESALLKSAQLSKDSSESAGFCLMKNQFTKQVFSRHTERSEARCRLHSQFVR